MESETLLLSLHYREYITGIERIRCDDDSAGLGTAFIARFPSHLFGELQSGLCWNLIDRTESSSDAFVII